MIEVIRNGSLCCATGLSIDQIEKMKPSLEYEEVTMEPGPMGKLVTVRETRRLWAIQEGGGLVFPCGFIDRVRKLITDMGGTVNSYKRVDERDITLKYDLNKIIIADLREQQKQFLRVVVTFEGGLVVSPTGSGKSYGMREICAMFYDSRIVIAAPRIEAVATLKRYLDDKFYGQVGQVGGGKRSTKRITISTFDSLTKVDDLEKTDILIVDEVHKAPPDKYRAAVSAYGAAVKRFGFTATPERYDGKEVLNEAMFGPIRVAFTYKDSQEEGAVTPIRVFVRDNTFGPDKSFLDKLRTSIDRDRYAIWRNQPRNRLIASDIKALVDNEIAQGRPDPQVLVIVDKTEHAYALLQELEGFTIVTGKVDAKRLKKLNKSGLDIEFTDLVSDNRRSYLRRLFENGELKRTVATKIWTESVSSNHCNIVVYAAGDAKVNDFIQAIGRGSRILEGKTYTTVLVYNDLFAPAYQARSSKLIRAANKQGHTMHRISA